MKQVKYLDCFASVGKWTGRDQEAPWTVEKMLTDMERCRIHGALVYSNLARELLPSVGNNQVLEICHNHPRLIPCWVALPHHCHEAKEGKQFVRDMIDKGVKAVKLFPRLHRYFLNEEVMGSLLHALEEAGLPMLIDCGEHVPELKQITWEEIEPLCRQFPNLNIILHSVRWEATRYLLPLARKFSTLHFEFSSYQANRIIEFLIHEIGSNQLLFGTQMMEKSPGAAKAFVDYVDIHATDRAKIAGGNLARLLKLERIPPDYPDDNSQDVILNTARNAEPIDDMEVIDSHAHISDKGHSDIVVAVMPQADAAGVVERNKRLGVDITCVSSWTGVWSDYERGNEVTRQALLDFPANIIGYATLDPNYVQNWQTEIKRCHETFEMKGLKPYFPRNKIPYNEVRYAEWFTYGNQHRLFSLMHMSDNFVVEMEDLAAKYPELTFLLAHSGMSYETARKHVNLCKKFSNVFCEITYTAVMNGIIEYMVREIGSERVLYGSDTSMRDPFPQFGWVAYADISESDKRNIFGRNMRKIIDRCFST